MRNVKGLIASWFNGFVVKCVAAGGIVAVCDFVSSDASVNPSWVLVVLVSHCKRLHVARVLVIVVSDFVIGLRKPAVDRQSSAAWRSRRLCTL